MLYLVFLTYMCIRASRVQPHVEQVACAWLTSGGPCLKLCVFLQLVPLLHEHELLLGKHRW